jgi:hypothetical protein
MSWVRRSRVSAGLRGGVAQAVEDLAVVGDILVVLQIDGVPRISQPQQRSHDLYAQAVGRWRDHPVVRD